MTITLYVFKEFTGINALNEILAGKYPLHISESVHITSTACEEIYRTNIKIVYTVLDETEAYEICKILESMASVVTDQLYMTIKIKQADGSKKSVVVPIKKRQDYYEASLR